jgi:hypothetical protein
MAAATVTGRRQNNIAGNRRIVYATSVVFASGSDTWATGLKQIDAIHLTPTTNVAPAFTVGTGSTAGTITAVNAGTYRGSVEGY